MSSGGLLYSCHEPSGQTKAGKYSDLLSGCPLTNFNIGRHLCRIRQTLEGRHKIFLNRNIFMDQFEVLHKSLSELRTMWQAAYTPRALASRSMC
jgi:hypothetical protein